MESIGIGIVTSLIADSLLAFASQGIQSARDAIDDKNAIKHEMESDKDLVARLRRVLEGTAKLPPNWSIEGFLRSPMVECIFRQMFSDHLGNGQRRTTDELREQFSIYLCYFLGAKNRYIDAYSDELFDAIYSGCRVALDVGISKGLMSAQNRSRAIE